MTMFGVPTDRRTFSNTSFITSGLLKSAVKHTSEDALISGLTDRAADAILYPCCLKRANVAAPTLGPAPRNSSIFCVIIAVRDWKVERRV